MKVFKYQIEPKDMLQVSMPKGAQVLTVQTQHGKPCIWALVDPEAPLEKRTFRMAGTGHDIEADLVKMKYIDTFQLLEGDLIFHLFEML